MTYHVKLEKKTGIPSQAVDTSEKLPELSRKKDLVSQPPKFITIQIGNTSEKFFIKNLIIMTWEFHDYSRQIPLL